MGDFYESGHLLYLFYYKILLQFLYKNVLFKLQAYLVLQNDNKILELFFYRLNRKNI